MKSKKVSERAMPKIPKKRERDTLLEQIQAKFVNLKPVVQTRPKIQDPRVDAFYERAYAIRLAFAGCDNCLLSFVKKFFLNFCSVRENFNVGNIRYSTSEVVAMEWPVQEVLNFQKHEEQLRKHMIAKVDERVNKAVAATNKSANAARVAAVKAAQKQRPNKSNGGDNFSTYQDLVSAMQYATHDELPAFSSPTRWTLKCDHSSKCDNAKFRRTFLLANPNPSTLNKHANYQEEDEYFHESMKMQAIA
ncbi:protein SCAR2 isoform X2 [Tanacetum coccineum]